MKGSYFEHASVVLIMDVCHEMYCNLKYEMLKDRHNSISALNWKVESLKI